jgi:uncharacterized protein DUF2786
MTENKTAILRRIRALADKTVANGCTEAEALAAAALFAKLVDKYGFTPADMADPLELLTEQTVATSAQKKGNYWFALAVAEYCDCRAFRRSTADDKKELVFFGTEADVLMCRYLMDVFTRANETGFKAFLRDERLNASHGFKKTTKERNVDRLSFDLGMSHRVKARLRDMKTERNATVDSASGKNGGALVVVKNALVNAEYAKRYKTRTVNRGTRYNAGAAYAAGAAHGSSVSINRGVGGAAQLRIA